MNYILFDDFRWDNLLPLTFTRPVCEIRVGILTIREKWEQMLGVKCSWLTKDYLSEKYPLNPEDDNIFINGSILPDTSLLKEISKLRSGQVLIQPDQIIVQPEEKQILPGEKLMQPEEKLVQPGDKLTQTGEKQVQPGDKLTQTGEKQVQPGGKLTQPEERFIHPLPKIKKEDTVIALRSVEIPDFSASNNFKRWNKVQFRGEFLQLNHTWDIFILNGEALISDFDLITTGKNSGQLSRTNTLLNPQNIFVEDGVKAESVTLNAESGPVYLGRNSEIMEGSTIRGPFALCENSTIKMGAKIYGPTTVGPLSKAGGEINNSVITGYSNKAHDGFLGHSVIGEWCNIGADSNNSNLKNTYGPVRLWSYPDEKFIHTGLMYCGLIMGDHSKCGINTMFNTGTVVGVSANIFGSGFPRNFIPSFSWGGPQGYYLYKLDQAIEVAKIVMSRRNVEFTETDYKILKAIFDKTQKYRAIGITH
jgi:UDP-N-acetylglucosamine diphosphorylase/glucosamine-1-phosphate N-acetyltransferase